MAIELRVWHTTEGIDIPYYKLPYTRTELYAAVGTFTTSNNLYKYPNFPGGSLLGPPYLRDMRWIAEKVFKGWNPRNAVAFEPAGSFRWLTVAGVGGAVQNHSPGTAEWIDRSAFEYLQSSGASIPSWMGNGQAQLRPYPGEYFDWANSGAAVIMGSTYAVTSDYKLVRLTFQSYANIYGWQGWYVSRADGSASQFPAMIDSMLSTLIETSDDEGETVARFNPRIAPSTIGCYVMNKEDLRDFLHDLWTTNTIESILTAFIGDGSNALLGVRWYYGIKDKIQYTEVESYVTLGQVAFRGAPTMPVATNEFVEYDAGSVVVPQHYGDYRDWAITSYQIYLPFIGVIDLDPRDVVGKTLYLKYWINITDGSAVCTLSTTPTTPNGYGTLFTTSCSWGYDIPVRVDSAMDLASRMAKMATSAAGSEVGSMMGGPGQYSVGELSPNSNVMGDFQPKLVIHRRDDISGPGFDAAQGSPGAAVTTVGACSGYLKVSEVYNAGSLSMRGADEIIALLKEGVYI